MSNYKITWNKKTPFIKKTTLLITQHHRLNSTVYAQNSKITWNKKTPLIKQTTLLITQNDKITFNKKMHLIKNLFCYLSYDIIFFAFEFLINFVNFLWDHIYFFTQSLLGIVQLISYKRYLECTLVQWRLSIYP